MKNLITFVAGRKETVRLVAVIHCALAMVMLTACAGRKEFRKGYERGASDTAKRQYWIQQNMQEAGQSKSPYRLTLYRIPVTPDPNASVKTVPYEIAIPFTNDAAAAARHLAMKRTILSFAIAAILAAQPHARAVLGVGDIVSDPICRGSPCTQEHFRQAQVRLGANPMGRQARNTAQHANHGAAAIGNS
jgi:hypothetical protein